MVDMAVNRRSVTKDTRCPGFNQRVAGHDRCMATLTPTLDRIEDNLPPVASRLFRLQRTVAGASYDLAANVVHRVSNAAGRVAGVSTTAARTTEGQARSAVERSLETVTAGAREVSGQARAQALRTVDAAEDAAVDLLDAADAAVDDRPSGAYETWTKDELYERASELDITGRSTMSKRQLIKALRAV